MTDITSNVSGATVSVTEPTQMSELNKPLLNSLAMCHCPRASASPPLSSHELELESELHAYHVCSRSRKLQTQPSLSFQMYLRMYSYKLVPENHIKNIINIMELTQ